MDAAIGVVVVGAIEKNTCDMWNEYLTLRLFFGLPPAFLSLDRFLSSS